MPAIERVCGEIFRLGLLRELEEGLDRAGFGPVAGVDEAGRGGLAGPVVAAAVIPGAGPPLPGVDDSKRLKPGQRTVLAEQIRATARAWVVTSRSPATIEAGNILRATRSAMLEAVRQLEVRPASVISDAVPLGELDIPVIALVKGDALSYAVACASILAKEERDRRMVALDRDYPHFGFARHKGYAAAEHLAALERFGPCREHRLTFASVVPRREAA